MNPLVYGEYPAIMKKNIAAKSMNEGLDKSRLPEFTLEQRDMVKGTVQYFRVFCELRDFDLFNLKKRIVVIHNAVKARIKIFVIMNLQYDSFFLDKVLFYDSDLLINFNFLG